MNDELTINHQGVRNYPALLSLSFFRVSIRSLFIAVAIIVKLKQFSAPTIPFEVI